MKLKKFFIYTFLNVCLCYVAMAQSGDQILDGIGETGLIARYLLEEDTKDWSRNNLHAITNGKETFTKDKLFKQVLQFSKGSKTFVSLPQGALVGEESLSISAWYYINSEGTNTLFSFGQEAKAKLEAVTNADGDTWEVQWVLANQKYAIAAEGCTANKWHHIAVVIDAPSRTINAFIDGKLTASEKDVDINLEALFNAKNTNKTHLNIGKSITSNTYLDGKIHDVRLYRIPLSDKQVTTIYKRALGEEDIVVNERKQQVDDLPAFDKETPQLYNQYLTSVANVEVTTSVGYLPRLPRYTTGTYKDGIKGPEVRVLWPAPENNDEVSKPGTYEVFGVVKGTNFKPKATIKVVAEQDAKTPTESLLPFALKEVSLNTDAFGQTTKFIENRDKFITTLATTNPDAFLYMFRNAFGQKQPEGAKPLGVWDSQETKLRGHATGHYLTAIAQAYASTGYDKGLQQQFEDKMEYMVNTLYTLSQLSGNPKDGESSYVSDPTAVPPGPNKSDYDSDLTEEGIRTDYWNWGKGFISAYPPDQFIMLEKGATYGGQKTQIWAPYYTLHKILAGLMDVYEVTGNEKALAVAKGMGSWVYARLKEVPTATLISMWNRYIAGEFGGMNEAMARLYRITNDASYLDVAILFDNIKMFYGNAEHSHGLAKNVDTFRGLHANQHVPQIMGALEMYRRF